MSRQGCQRTALAPETGATATAKVGDGQIEMIRLFKLAKASATKVRSP